MPRKIAGSGALDLDHPRAQIGQLPRGKGRCNRMFQ
jgi:hypothetical protein